MVLQVISETKREDTDLFKKCIEEMKRGAGYVCLVKEDGMYKATNQGLSREEIVYALHHYIAEYCHQNMYHDYE